MDGKQLNSNQFPDVYEGLGISIAALGVVMLDTDPIQVTEMVDQGKQDLYESINPERFWISGAVAEHQAHVTLLYGLMQKGLVWKSYIDRLLDGWTPPMVEIEKVGVFASPYADDDYACIVGHIKVSDKLLEGHHRLQLLPHIDTFPEYRPHITLAYVKPEAEKKWVTALEDKLVGKKLSITKINYGGTNA